MTPDRDAPTKSLSASLAARELLTFDQEAGVDALVGELPVDRLAGDPPGDIPAAASEAVAPRSSPQVAAPPAQPPRTVSARDLDSKGRATAPPSPDAAVMAAREAARTAVSLEELRAIVERFEGCALRNTATRLVFADGNPRSRVMFVGEAPGRDEDIEGLPFVGRSGKLLDLMMAAIGLDRTPTPQESAICLPFILRQIELANPDVLVCLGGPSAATLLNIRDGILKARGRWFTHQTGTRDIRAIATLHPAYLLRQPLQKRLAWRDFLAIKKALSTT
jgi:uracil-DNA glycosylase